MMSYSFKLPNTWLKAWQAGNHVEQAIVLLLALLAAGCVLFLWRRFLHPQEQEERWKTARQKVGVIIFPFTAWSMVWLGIALGKTQKWYHTNMLETVIAPLLAAMLMIRLLVHTLRRVFGEKTWVLKSERWVSWLIWLGFLLHTVGILAEIYLLLDSIKFTFGKHTITVLSVLTAIITIAISLLTSLWLGSVIEKRLMRTKSIELNTRVVLNKICRALLLFLGLFFALQLAGIDLTLFTVFGGALGVGLGFGLQKIASNYISGFIILLDRSLRPGDMVVIDGQKGELTEFTARYVVVKDLAGAEAIIPNDTLITSTVLNLSYTTSRLKVAIPVQIAYHSDAKLAMQLLLTIAQTTPRVMTDPAPQVYLLAFADSGINLELSIWIQDPLLGESNLRTEINLRILEEFQKAGIEIPYPRRDIAFLNTAAMQQ